MDPEVMRQHIELYVNDFSADLGEVGKQSIETLYRVQSGDDQKVVDALF